MVVEGCHEEYGEFGEEGDVLSGSGGFGLLFARGQGGTSVSLYNAEVVRVYPFHIKCDG